MNIDKVWRYTKQQLIDGVISMFEADTGLNKFIIERRLVPGCKTVYNRKLRQYEQVDNTKVEFFQKHTSMDMNIDYLHEKSVFYALKNGENVPWVVLKEYGLERSK